MGGQVSICIGCKMNMAFVPSTRPSISVACQMLVDLQYNTILDKMNTRPFLVGMINLGNLRGIDKSL